MALPKIGFTQVPELQLVSRPEKSGRITNTQYGDFFIYETKLGFEVTLRFFENDCVKEVLIPKSIITLEELNAFLLLEPFARQITSDGGIEALSSKSLDARNLNSLES